MPILLADLLKREFPPETYLVGSGLMHDNSLLFIGGPPKVYKSFMLNTMAIQLATGAPLLGATRRDKHQKETPAFPVNKPCRVLVLEQEVGEVDMQSRMRQMISALPEEIQRLCGENLFIHSCDHTLRLDGGREGIAKLVEPVKPDVICFDPLKEFHYADENSAQEMSAVMSSVDWLRERFKFATIISHHTVKPSKDSNRDGPDQLRGSGYLFGKGDSFVMLRPHGRRNTGALYADFTIRRGKPIPAMILQLNPDTLMVEFQKWAAGAERQQPGDPIA